MQQRYLQGCHKLVPARTLLSITVLHRIYDAIQGHVIFMEALFEPLVKFLAYAGVHARLLLGDQVAKSDSFIDIVCLIEINLTFFNGLPRLVNVVVQAWLDLVPHIDVEDNLARCQLLSLGQLTVRLSLSLALAVLLIQCINL